MNLNALSFVELGAFPNFRVRVPNSSKFNHVSCFFNPDIKMPLRSQSSRSLIITPSRLPSSACLPSFLHRDCALRPRVRATTKDDDTGDSSSDDEDLDLWKNISHIDPDYAHYGLIYYNVLVLSCQITWMLNFNSQIPDRAKKDSLSCFKRIIKRFSISDVKAIKGTNHYKIAELFLKQKCRSHPYILSVFEYLPSMQQAEFINNVASELMLMKAIDIVNLDVLSNMTEELCDLISMYDDFGPNIAASTRTSKFTVANCALVLSRELHEIHTRLREMKDFDYDIEYYLNNVEEEVVARGLWPRVFQKCRVSLFETHDCVIEMKNALQKINSSMMGVGRLVCECMTCYDFKEHTMSTMEIDDFDDIQKNLKLADENLEQLLPYPNFVKSAGEISTNYFYMRNIFLGFTHSLIAYRSIWRGIRLFDKKINEAHHEGNKFTLRGMRKG